ncbi:MAG: sulfatase, partial [Sedimentisphaerales bacterium]|nr:sulfatase [Sedimentisphaerales bacterium]
MNRRTFMNMSAAGLASLLLPKATGNAKQTAKQPNILWIMVEDMSPHLSCYGETTIKTPNLDRLASQGAMFTNCFVTSPVCSPSRSAMITGMYQTTIGAHNHRSSRGQFPINLPSQIKLLPEYFRQAGYYVCNGNSACSNVNDFGIKQYRGKTDYNFVYDKSLYDGLDWSGRQKGQPFFAQIQLLGGKRRHRVTVPHPVDPAKVKLPPYYPDHPILRQDWAEYLNSVIITDYEVKHILNRLDEEGVADNTIVIFLTDHGISHARDKQFLYEGGIHVPLIIRWPGKIKPGTVRDDLISHI